jgi:hypothetical protein
MAFFFLEFSLILCKEIGNLFGRAEWKPGQEPGCRDVASTGIRSGMVDPWPLVEDVK